ncbi:MAG: hypothetical protein ABJD11_04775 [Gemmatimonadota bacterium]
MKTFLVLLILIAGVAYLITREKPGTGGKARVGMSRAAPLVNAVEAYRSAHGGYPAALEDLVPDFIGSIPHEIDGHPIIYDRHGSTYGLTFSYMSPLPTHCTFTPTQTWTCAWL